MVIIELFIVYKGNARLHIYLIDNFKKIRLIINLLM